ncbi:DUF4303 domain-containing protein [Paenibacillus sp. FSL H8-0332]|uniref:DUF4303 domain-containing protein n=1 Tax=Paenibacillus sp. FSL H8-0332 TaxID=2954742 RepID=UPI0030D2D0CA
MNAVAQGGLYQDLEWLQHVKRVCSSCSPLELSLNAPISIGDSVIGLGVRSQHLSELHSRLVRAVSPSPELIARYFELDSYLPHLTLGQTGWGMNGSELIEMQALARTELTPFRNIRRVIMNDFLTEFEQRIREGFVADLEAILEEVAHEKVYVCAVGTDSDFVTLFLAVNTEQSLARHIADMTSEGLCDDAETELYYKWGISEFQYGEHSHFNHISRFLYAEDNVYQYKDEMVKIIAKVVNETKDDLFTKYNQTKEDITFFVSMTDDELLRN